MIGFRSPTPVISSRNYDAEMQQLKREYEERIDGVNLVNIELGLQVNELRETIAGLNEELHHQD